VVGIVIGLIFIQQVEIFGSKILLTVMGLLIANVFCDGIDTGT
jgi:hypothetical protein